jgi:hypothetical protein
MLGRSDLFQWGVDYGRPCHCYLSCTPLGECDARPHTACGAVYWSESDLYPDLNYLYVRLYGWRQYWGVHNQSVRDDCIHIWIPSNNDVYNTESSLCLLFRSNDLHSFANPIYNYEYVYNPFNGSVGISYNIADTDTIPPVVPRSRRMLP